MARAKIKINGSDATTTTVAIGAAVLLSNDDNGGELTYAWSFLDQPEGTGDAIAGPAVKNASFVPTKEGTYQVRLVVNALLGTESIQTAAIAVLDARTGQRIPAATETTETSTAKGWALALNRILASCLHASVDSNVVVALSPGSIAAGRIVKLGAMGTANVGTQSAVDLPQAVAVNATGTVIGRLGIAVDGVVPGDLGAGKLILVRMFGLVPFVGTGSPSVGDAVFLSDAGVAALIAGSVSRTIGRVVLSSAGSYRWVIDGADSPALPALAPIATSGSASDLSAGTVPATRMPALSGDVSSSAGSTVTTVGALPESRITNLVSDLAAKANTSSLAAIATSGSAADLATGAVPAARMPALTGDVTTIAGAVATTIAGNAVTNAKLATMGANTIKGSVAGGNPADLTATQAKGVLAISTSDVSGLAAVATSGSAADLSAGTLLAARMPALTGDVTTTVGTVAATIAANAVTNAKAAQMAANTIKGNNTGGTANAADLTIAQVIALLGIKVGQFGDGSDGVATMDGTTAVTGMTLTNSGPSGVYTAQRSCFFSSVTISAGITCKPDGWPIYVAGNTANNGDINSNGGDASGVTNGTAAISGTRLLPVSLSVATASTAAPQVFPVSTASNGGATAGGAGTAGAPGSTGTVGRGGGGGAGGNNNPFTAQGTSGTSGPNISGQGTASQGDIRVLAIAARGANYAGTPFTPSTAGGAGGAGGSGAAGGGSGAAGGYVFWATFSASGSGTWRSKGGVGGAGGAGGAGIGGGGGGGGGSGGLFVLVVGGGTAPTPDVSGGTGGAGGAGGSGSAGNGGLGGTGGAGYALLL